MGHGCQAALCSGCGFKTIAAQFLPQSTAQQSTAMSTDDSTTRLMKAVVATLFMLVLGCLLTPTFSDWYRHGLANRLAAQIADKDDAKVKVPLRQLAELGETAIEPLVVAAVSDRAAVATIARQILEEKLATWTALAESKSTRAADHDFASSLAMLATSIADHLVSFGPGGKQWAERIALTLIELTVYLPARQTHQLLDRCSYILAAVPPRGPRLRTLTPRTKIDDIPVSSRMQAPEPRLESLTRVSEGSLEVLARAVPRRHESGRTTLEPVTSELKWATRWEGEYQVQVPTPRPLVTPKKVLPTNPLTNSTPGNTTLKIAPVDNGDGQNVDREKVDSQVVDVPSPQEMTTRAETLRQWPSEALLLRLPDASFYEAGLIRTVLVERGFDEAVLTLRQQLASPVIADRLRLVDEVSQLSATTARRLLRWLLDDTSGEVRLRALTALATTQSPDLRELARELAASDKDPRVAELASRLLRKSRF